MVKKIRNVSGIEIWNRVVKEGLTQVIFEPSLKEARV